MVKQAAAVAAKTCDVCDVPGSLPGPSTWRVRCETHDETQPD
jgi:hypothetical protein